MSKIPIASSSEKKVEVKTEIQEAKGQAVQTPESTNKTILALGLDPLLRDKVFQKPDINLTADLNACYFSGSDAIYKGSAAFDHSFSQDQKSGYYTQLGAWLERVRTLSAEVKFDGFSKIETLINKLRNPKIYYNFATDEIRDKTIASIKRSLEFILLKLLQKFQLAKDSSQSIQDEIIAILSQIAEAGERCSSQLKNIEATVDLLSLDLGLIGRIHAYLLEVILPKFYQRCIAEEQLPPGYHVHVADNTRMWLSETIIDLHWLKPPADDDFAQVPGSEKIISRIRTYIATHLINTLREEFTFEAICLREVTYLLPQGLAILKKYRGQDLNCLASSIEEESEAEVRDEWDQSEQDGEVKRPSGKEFKSDLDREVKRRSGPETESEPDAKKEMNFLYNFLVSEFEELIHYKAFSQGDLVTSDEEDFTQQILNPEFEANLFSYYMNYVAEIMFQQRIAGEFSSYAAAEMSQTHTPDDLIRAFREGRLYKARMLVNAGVDSRKESKEDSCALSVILSNFNKGKKIYVDSHSHLTALNILLSSKKAIEIDHLPDDFLVKDFYPDVFERFIDWIVNLESGISILQKLILNESNSMGFPILLHLLENGEDYPTLGFILLRKIKIKDLKSIANKFVYTFMKNVYADIVVSIITDVNSASPSMLWYENAAKLGLNHFKKLDRFKDLLMILRTQCVLTADFYLLLAEKLADTLEKLMLVLEFCPELKDRYDWNEQRLFENRAFRSAPALLAAERGQVKYLAKILSIPNVNPNLRDSKGNNPLSCAIEGGKHAKQQKELVRLFLENKKFIIQDFNEIMQIACQLRCHSETFSLLLRFCISAAEKKGDASEKLELKMDGGMVLTAILYHNNGNYADKLNILLNNLFMMDKIASIPDTVRDGSKVIKYLSAIKDVTDPDKIVCSYAEYCLWKYRGERGIDPTLTLPVFSLELKNILDKQLGVERRQFLENTVSEFNATNKFRPFLAMVVSNQVSQPLLLSEFKKGVNAFLNELIDKMKVSEDALHTYLTTFCLLYSHKKKISGSDNNSIRLNRFISFLFRIAREEDRLPIVSSLLLALIRADNPSTVDIFCNGLITEYTIVADDKFLLSVLKYLEEMLRNTPGKYDEFIKPIFDKLKNYPSFWQCSEACFYFFVYCRNKDFYPSFDSSSYIYYAIQNSNNILLNMILEYLRKNSLIKLPVRLVSDAISCGNYSALKILFHPDYISMFVFDEFSLLITATVAVNNNCSFDTIKVMLTLLPISMWSAPHRNGFLDILIEKGRWDIILLAGTRGIPHDYLAAPSNSHRLYNSVRTIILAMDAGKSLDEIENLLADFDLVSEGSEFSRTDLVKIIHTQFVAKPKLYVPFFTYLFEQTIPKTDADVEQKEKKESKQEYKLEQKAAPVVSIEKCLLETLEIPSVNFLCDIIKQGKTHLVMHALNNGAYSSVSDSITYLTPLQLVVTNNVVPKFSDKDQLLIVNALLNSAGFVHPQDTDSITPVLCESRASSALCLRLSLLFLRQPPTGFNAEDYPVHLSTRAHLIWHMSLLWKSCLKITQPDECRTAAITLYDGILRYEPRIDAELLENVLTELKKQLSQFRKEYYQVIAMCYGFLIDDMFRRTIFYPELVSKFCKLAWMGNDRTSLDMPSFLPLKTLVEKDSITSVFFTEAITSNRDYSEALSLLFNSPVSSGWNRQHVVQFLSTDKYQYESKAGAISGEQKQLPVCQYALQSGDAELLTKLLALRDSSSLADDLKSYPVQLALCQHPEWLVVNESKQSFQSSVFAKPKNAQIIAYFKQILPQVLRMADLTSVHTVLLGAHKIELQDITNVGIYQAIFEAILRPRVKLPNLVPTDVRPPALNR